MEEENPDTNEDTPHSPPPEASAEAPLPGSPVSGTPVPGTPVPGTPVPGTPFPEASLGEDVGEDLPEVSPKQSDVLQGDQQVSEDVSEFNERKASTGAAPNPQAKENVKINAQITAELNQRKEDSGKKEKAQKKGKGKRKEKDIPKEGNKEEAEEKQGKKSKGGGEGDVEKKKKGEGKLKKETTKGKKTKNEVTEEVKEEARQNVLSREGDLEEEVERVEIKHEKIEAGGKDKLKRRSSVKDSEVKKAHKVEAREEVASAGEEEERGEMSMMEASFRASKVPEGSLAVPGVKRIAISPEVQQQLGCAIGVNVTSESPWILVDRTHIEDSLFLHSESSDFLPIKQEFQDVKMPSILVGYDALNDEPNQFYICLTEKAQETILEMLEEMKLEQQRRLENALEKTPREWTSLGSEADVELFNIEDSRPYMRVLVETTAEKISQPCNFSNRDVEDAKDGYYRFPKTDEPSDQIWCYRLDAGVQVRNPREDASTQTTPYIPYNTWTQYEYEIDTEAPIKDEETLKSLAQFLERVEAPMSEVLSYNEILDNYRDDYAKLVVDEEDTDIPPSAEFAEFASFTDMKHCQGKAVSCVAYHPMWTGIVAIAYVEQGKIDVPKLEKTDEIAVEVYANNRVLIWSLNDAFKPKLILDSPRQVFSLAFAHHREELLVGGLSNGQIVIWDIKGKIERVETEIKLTPAQIRHRLAMMNMMDWMKHTIQIQYLRPVAVSSLQHSHTDIVYELRFLHPCWTVDSAGKFEALQDAHSTILLSLSLDTSILVWNLDPDPSTMNKVVSMAVRARKRKTARRPDGLKSEASPYAIFHRAVTPILKIDLPLAGDKVGEMFRSMDMYIPPVNYVPNEEEWAKLSTKQKKSSATRFKYLPVLSPPEDDEQIEQAFVGTSSGQLLAMGWEDSEPKGSAVIQNLSCNIEYTSHIHDGPILQVLRSPFIEDMYLTFDWDKFAIWSSKLKSKPFLVRRQRSGKRYISASWSLISAMTICLCCSDGSIEIWDLNTRSEIYSVLQNVSGLAINVVRNHPRPLPVNLVGLADSTGCFRLFSYPITYHESSKICEEKMKLMVEREVKRTATMQRWVAEWMRKNLSDLKQKKKSIFEDVKVAVYDDKRMSLIQKPEDVEVVEQPGKKKYKKYEMTNIEDNRKHMMKMMMEKKRIDRNDLERKRAPLVQAQEAMQLKQLKLRQVQKNKNKIFKETIHVMFPDVAEKPPPKPTDCEILAAELEEKQDSFIKDYKELEEIALAKLRTPEVVHDFNWKRVVQDGQKRREVLDLDLYLQTEWKERSEERSKERRLHKESELRREDERKRKKKGVFQTTSSQMVLPSGSTLDAAMFDGDSRDVEWAASRLLTPLGSSKMSVKQTQSRERRPQSSRVNVKDKESSTMQPQDSKIITSHAEGAHSKTSVKKD